MSSSISSEGKAPPGLPGLTCVAEMSLVWMAIVVPWVPVHLLLGVGRGHVDLLGVRIVRHMGLGHHRITAGARGLRAERLLHAGHVLLLLLLLQGATERHSSALPPKHPDWPRSGLSCLLEGLVSRLCAQGWHKRGGGQAQFGSSASTPDLYRAAWPGSSLYRAAEHRVPHQTMLLLGQNSQDIVTRNAT